MRLRRQRADDGEVDLVDRHRLAELVADRLAQFDPHLGIAAAEALQRLAHQIARQRRRAAEAKLAAGRVRQVHDLGARLMPRQKRRAELVFQQLDLPAERGLRHAQLGCRAREIAVLCNRHEIAQLFEIHAVFPGKDITGRHGRTQIIQLDLWLRNLTMSGTGENADNNDKPQGKGTPA